MKNRSSTFWGIALLLIGSVLTAVNFNLLPFEEPGIIPGFFLMGGLLFFVGYLTSGLREWGWLFPASILSGVGTGIWLEDLTHVGEFTGAIIVFSVAIPFWVAYLTSRRDNWWAIIPGGVLTAVSAMIAGIGLHTLPEEVWVGGMLAGIGLVFLFIYWSRPKNWWAIIPGGILMAVGLMIAGIGLNTLPEEIWVGAMLGGMGLVFLLLYWTRQTWWAIIPGGSLLAVGSTVLLAGLNLPDFWEVRLAGSSLFIVLSVTFGVLWLLRDKHQTSWARYPSAILGAIGLFVLVTGSDGDMMISILMIGAGVWLLWRSRGKKENPAE